MSAFVMSAFFRRNVPGLVAASRESDDRNADREGTQGS